MPVGSNAIREAGGELVNTLLSRSVIVVGVLFVAGAIGFIMWWFGVYKKKFDIDVKLTFERSGDKNWIRFDKAAVLRDRKTKTKYLRVWGMKVDLPIPKHNVLQLTNKGDYVEIYSTGEDEYYFLTLAKVSKTMVIKSDGKLYRIAEQIQSRIDTDIVYWNIKRKQLNKSMFDPESILMKLLPYIPLMMVSVVMLFVAWVFLDKLPAILSQLQSLVKQMADSQRAQVITGIIPIMFLKLKNKFKK